jgi:hypothetical protein
MYAAQASDGDNWHHDSPACRDILLKQIMPFVRYYAYIEITPDRHQSLWEAYEEVKRGASAISPCGRSTGRPTSTRCSGTCSRGACHDSSRLIADSSEWTFPMLERYNEVIGQIAANEFGLDTYPNQIEIITAEQMMDAYSSVGMPLGYKHWSYGKQFVLTEKNYRRGQMGLAYEIVINSDPCIAYLMEENTAMMQALVIAHAAYGHNSFFKGNYLFRTWTSADAIIDYLLFARNYVAECEEHYGEEERGTVPRFLPCA